MTSFTVTLIMFCSPSNGTLKVHPVRASTSRISILSSKSSSRFENNACLFSVIVNTTSAGSDPDTSSPFPSNVILVPCLQPGFTFIVNVSSSCTTCLSIRSRAPRGCSRASARSRAASRARASSSRVLGPFGSCSSRKCG
ncbi:proprotein convertase subtilisin/kexin type 9 [Striga asiatica]|uniref:Proprotein convertase subtilisin/kexin type 9 n=1 Tax=Striga asiatica TaxID=4170 RepID=A0A5A7PYV6_STRAF|nr:proprotein convertase subtilisin/kexin type 9 [Striga asiatica]